MLRGSLLAIVLLTVWWLLLSGPLLVLLRSAVQFSADLLPGRSSLTVTENANRDWTFEVPLEARFPATAPNLTPQQIHSIDFDMARSDANGFTFGLPVVWALMLAGPSLRRNWRPLLWGTLLMAALEVVLLLITVETLAHRSVAQLLDIHDPLSAWLWKFSDYLTVNALPYVLPFVVVLLVHRGLRQQIFQWASLERLQVPIEVDGGERKRKRKAKAARQGRGQYLPG